MRRWALIVAAAFWGAIGTAHAAPLEPLAIVAFESVARLRDDLAFVGTLAGQPRLVGAIEAALSKATRITAIPGWDETRPCGLFVWSDGLAVFPAVCVPVKDLDQLLAAISPLVGSVEKLSDGVHRVGRGSATGYVARRGDWGWLVQTPERLTGLPDPAAFLTSLTKSQVAVLQIHPRRIPEAVLAMPFDRARDEISARLVQRPGETAEQHPALRAAALEWLNEAARLTTQTERVSIGVSLDREAKRAAVEARWTPASGSAVAQRLEAWRRPASLSRRDDAGESIARLDACVPLSDVERRWVLAGVNEARNDLVRLAANWPAAPTERQQKLMGEMLESVYSAIEVQAADGRVELSARLASHAPPKPPSEATYFLEFLGRLGDERTCERCRQRVVSWATADDGLLRARPNGTPSTWDIDRRQIAQLAPVGEAIWGPRPGLRVARDGSTLAVALGTLTSPVKAPAPESRPSAGHVEIELRLAPLCQLAADAEVNQLAVLAANLLKGQDDRLAWRLAPDDAGLAARLEVGGGILRALGMAIALGAR